MEYTKVLYFLMMCMIILTVFVLYLFFPLISLSAPHTDTRPITDTRPVTGISIINQSGEIDQHTGTYIVTGTARNIGTNPIAKVNIVLTTYDENGSVLGSTSDTLTNVNPGDHASFRIEAWPYLKGDLVSQYSLEPDYRDVSIVAGAGNFLVPTTGLTLPGVS